MQGNIQENVFEPLDTEHRDGLLVCWKIREGIRKEVDIHRIKKYLEWYWESYLKKVFELEEEYLFQILPKDDKTRKKVTSQHKKLKKHFEEKNPLKFLKSILLIEEELESHIRFAEKELQQKVLELATPQQLQDIEMNVKEMDELEWKDPFWK